MPNPWASLTPDDLLALQEIADDLRTQDNQATAEPIYVVEQVERTYYIELDFAEQFVFVNDDGEEVDSEAEGATKVGCSDRWIYVTCFLTQRAADFYISRNRHNLKNPRVFVASGYRNDEIQLLRRALMRMLPERKTA